MEGYWKERPAEETQRKVEWFRITDVKEVRAKMKMKGAGGEDGVQNCMIKRGSKELNKALTLMANILATLEVVPDKSKLTVMVPAYKEGRQNVHEQLQTNRADVGALQGIRMPNIAQNKRGNKDSSGTM